MFNPFSAAMTVQSAMIEAWMKAAGAGTECWRQWFTMQQNLLKELPYNRWHTIVPNGASFLDGYGRRTHDIDPERDV